LRFSADELTCSRKITCAGPVPSTQGDNREASAVRGNRGAVVI
jgi:hypothetical protein